VSGRHRWADTRDGRRFRDATGVDRHLSLWCSCFLLDCCHNEDQPPCSASGPHHHSGTFASGFLYPGEMTDLDRDPVVMLMAAGARNIWPAY
jgi:hypothetical protein